MCILWAQLTRSYRILTGARYKVINEMETRLPAAPYTDEWRRIKENPDHRGYTTPPSPRLEAWVPWIFAAIYAVLLVTSLIVGGPTDANIAPSQ